VRAGDRVNGTDPQHDENLLRLLYTLSELSSKPAYREAADAELKWLLQNTASPFSRWDATKDELIPGADFSSYHPDWSPSGAQIAFWVFAALMGLSIASIFLVYAHASIARVFFITAASFGALSLYGYTTNRDLSAWGSFLFMGLIGIIIAMLVNLFLASSALQFAISVIGVLIFAGLTAYDTQQIKEMYYVGDDGTVAGRKAVMGALRLYLDFINLFMMLLQLFGDRR